MSSKKESVVKPKLHRYQGLILSLIPHASHSRLFHVVSKACRDRYGVVSEAIHHEIVSEVKLLGAPCERRIDLRSFFDDCSEFKHQNITHHLDKKARGTFTSQLKKSDGVYNMAIYKHIMIDSKVRRQQQQEPTGKSKSQLLFPVKEQPLINHNFYKKDDSTNESKTLWMDRRLDKLDENIIVAEGYPVDVLRTEPGFLRIKLSKNDKKPTTEKIFIYIYQHNHDVSRLWPEHKPLKIAGNIIRKHKIEHTGAEVLDLKINRFTSLNMSRLYDEYTQAVSRANQLTRENQIEPLYDSILAKIHQQWWSSKKRSLSMLLENTKNEGLRPLFKINNLTNQFLTDFIEGQSGITVESIVSLPQVQKIAEKKTTASVLVGVVNDGSGGRLSDKPAVLFSYDFQQAINDGKARVFRVTSETLSPDRIINYPSALPKINSGDLALLNRPLPSETRALIKRCVHKFDIDDISDFFTSVKNPQRSHGPKDRKGLSAKIPLWVSQPNESASVIFSGENELRREDRFECTLEVFMESASDPEKRISGTTENISPNGLKVKCKPLFQWEAGEHILVTVTLPFGKKSHTFKKQPYQLVGQAGKNNLRLEFVGTSGSRNILDRAIQQFLYQNMDRLKRCVRQNEIAPRLTESTQHLEAFYPDGVPFFVEQNKQQWFIRSASTQRQSRLYPDDIDKSLLEELNMLFNQPAFRELCLQSLNATSQEDNSCCLYIVTSSDKKQTFFARNLKNLYKQTSLLQLLKNTPTEKRPVIVKVDLSRAGTLAKKGFIAEEKRLQRISQHKVQDIQRIVDTTVGVGTLKNITEDAWLILENLFNLPNAETAKKVKNG